MTQKILLGIMDFNPFKQYSLLLLIKVSLVYGNCGDPPVIPNASHDGTAPYIENDSVTYNCEIGYTKHGPARYTCRGGNWEDGSVECRIRSCPSIDLPVNVHYADDQRSRTVGSELKFKCVDCYTLRGPSSIVCRSDGAWSSNSLPTCDVIKCPEFRINRGNVDQDYSVDSERDNCGRVNTITCNRGYSVNGPSQITCQANGTWSGNPTCEETKCKPLLVKDDTCLDWLSDQSTSVGSTPIVDCDPDATLVGSENPICQENGRWSDSPRCYCSCYPYQLNLALVQYSSLTDGDNGMYVKHGSELNWQCPGGYFKSTTQVTCENGAFSRNFSCLEEPPPPTTTTTKITTTTTTPEPVTPYVPCKNLCVHPKAFLKKTGVLVKYYCGVSREKLERDDAQVSWTERQQSDVTTIGYVDRSLTIHNNAQNKYKLSFNSEKYELLLEFSKPGMDAKSEISVEEFWCVLTQGGVVVSQKNHKGMVVVNDSLRDGPEDEGNVKHVIVLSVLLPLLVVVGIVIAVVLYCKKKQMNPSENMEKKPDENEALKPEAPAAEEADELINKTDRV